jgi:hypothetical protein
LYFFRAVTKSYEVLINHFFEGGEMCVKHEIVGIIVLVWLTAWSGILGVVDTGLMKCLENVVMSLMPVSPVPFFS